MAYGGIMKKYLLCGVMLCSLVLVSFTGRANTQKEWGDPFLTQEESALAVKKNLFIPSTPDVLYFQTRWLKKEIDLNKNKNFVISPVSLYQALALFGHGLNTSLLKGALQYPKGMWGDDSDPSVDQSSFRIQLPENMLSDGQVKISNSIWGNQFLPSYQRDVKTYLNADAMLLPENTSVINKWIEEKTEGKISDLLPQKETKPLDLFLVNTVYFKADWLQKFDLKDTRKMPFLTPTGFVDVDMMFDKRKAEYFEDEKMQAIRLAYRSDMEGEKSKHNMTFILPKEGVDFNEFLSKLKIEDFYLNFLENMPVKIYLPKFKLAYQPENMVDTLKKMGLESIFQEGVFKGSENSATLMDVVHKSIISVDEEGTEAAAATAMIMGDTGLFWGLEQKDPYFIFKADRPFLFMVDDGVFVGIVNDPTKD